MFCTFQNQNLPLAIDTDKRAIQWLIHHVTIASIDRMADHMIGHMIDHMANHMIGPAIGRPDAQWPPNNWLGECDGSLTACWLIYGVVPDPWTSLALCEVISLHGFPVRQFALLSVIESERKME